MKKLLILFLLLCTGISCTGIDSASVKPSKTTLTYGQHDQDGDSVNGDYDNQNFKITQEFTWQ